MIHYYLREIYLQDTDAAGIVFFSQVLTLCHEAYEACLKGSGVDLPQLVAQDIILPIVATECQFKRPMVWGETMTFNLLPKLLGENKFAVNYEIYNDQQQLAAIAKTVHLCLAQSTTQRLPLPPKLKAWVNAQSLSSEE